MTKRQKKKPKIITLPFTKVAQGSRTILLTAMTAELLVKISYVARRRQVDEKGAVQRPLNESRISKISNFALGGGDFPVCIILNWVTPERLQLTGSSLKITVAPNSAQLIDGQHRVAGLGDAMLTKSSIGKMEIPVAIYRDLSEEECADIFLSINTEQKPVPKSLVYDLFNIASSRTVDPAAARAEDIASFLNDEEDSPYHGLVKYVGDASQKMKMGVALSTFVNAFKPLVASGGVFSNFKILDLKNQTRAVSAYFKVLQGWYGSEWRTRDNVFMHAAGVTGGIDFFKEHLIPYCSIQKSYSAATMRAAMRLDRSKLISKKEAERMGGRAMARTVKQLLVSRFSPSSSTEDDIEFDK